MTAPTCLQAGVCSARGGLPAILASTILASTMARAMWANR